RPRPRPARGGRYIPPGVAISPRAAAATAAIRRQSTPAQTLHTAGSMRPPSVSLEYRVVGRGESNPEIPEPSGTPDGLAPRRRLRREVVVVLVSGPASPPADVLHGEGVAGLRVCLLDLVVQNPVETGDCPHRAVLSANLDPLHIADLAELGV